MALKSLKNISQADLTASDRDRFLKKINIPEDKSLCWEWIAYKNSKGYGAIMYRDLGNIPAHRFSYLLFRGNFNQKRFVCHHCDNPSCVNPDHLFVGTPKQNNRDKIKKGRAKNPPIHKGINQHKALVNPEMVREIRKMREQGSTYIAISKNYPISHIAVRDICRRKSWKDVL